MTNFEPLTPGDSLDSISIEINPVSSYDLNDPMFINVVDDDHKSSTPSSTPISREPSQEQSSLFSTLAAVIEPLTRASSSNDSIATNGSSKSRSGKSGKLLIHIPSLSDLFGPMWLSQNGVTPTSNNSTNAVINAGQESAPNSNRNSRTMFFSRTNSSPSSVALQRCTSPTDLKPDNASPSMLLRAKMKKSLF